MGKRRAEKNVFGFEGSYIRIFDKIFDILALGFLWILCSIPIITVGVFYSPILCNGKMRKKSGRIYITGIFPLF